MDKAETMCRQRSTGNLFQKPDHHTQSETHVGPSSRSVNSSAKSSRSRRMTEPKWKSCLTSQGRRRVVTAMIRRQSDGNVLMLKRAGDLQEYPGQWHFVSGSLEHRDAGRCLERARCEVLEETGITEQYLVCQGRPVRIGDKFLVHPFLFEVADSQATIILNAENQGYQWVAPEAIETVGEKVPRLVETWNRTQAPDRFPPRIKDLLHELTKDRIKDPGELAKSAVRCLDEYAKCVEGESIVAQEFMDIAWAVAISRPLMATVSNAVLAVVKDVRSTNGKVKAFPARALHDAVSRFCMGIDDEARRLRDHVVHLLQAALRRSSSLVTGLRILTHSDSPGIREALLSFHRKTGSAIGNVFICESRPRYEGQALASYLCSAGIPCTLITDSQMVLFACNADIAIVDAQTIRGNTDAIDIIGKVGCYSLALAARERSLAIHVMAALSKVHHGLTPFELEELSPAEVTSGYPSRISSPFMHVRHVNCEAVPSRLWTSIVTDKGVMKPESLPAVVKSNAHDFDHTFF